MIRMMIDSDKPAVMNLIEATGFFRPEEMTVAEELIDSCLEWPEQSDYRTVVVEDEAGRTAGYMSYGPSPLAIGTYDLYWMAVDPQSQGRGYGRLLVEWLEALVRKEGGRLLIIETSSTPKYEPTRRFYLGLKYTEIARIPDYYQPGDDRVIYIKRFG